MLKIGDISVGKGSPLLFILGPCVIESESMVLDCAKQLQDLCPFPFIFKASFDKANRTSLHSFRGVGMEKGLDILAKVKELGLPVTSDIHLPEQAAPASRILDLLQIPAFLCRQTDLLLACAETGKPVNVKKGQFVSPQDMGNVVSKLDKSRLMLTERGSCFGYNNLVCDMRSIPTMQTFGVPVCFDASHSVQLPGGLGQASSGERHFIPTLAKAAVAAGANAIFIETHPRPDEAKSHAHSQWPLPELNPLLSTLNSLHA